MYAHWSVQLPGSGTAHQTGDRAKLYMSECAGRGTADALGSGDQN